MKFSPFRPCAINLVIAAICVCLGGCPQTLVKRLEQVQPPAGYHPITELDTTEQISLDSLVLRVQRIQADTYKTRFSAHSNGEDTTAGTEITPPMPCLIALQPRHLAPEQYPREIVFDVAALDELGRLVVGLAPPYYSGQLPWQTLWFWLSDSCRGVTTRVDSFSIEEIRAQRGERYAVAFVLDHSPSMGLARIVRLRQAIYHTLQQFLPGDAATVVAFGRGNNVEVPITTDTSAFRRFNPSAAQMMSGTAIYDAVAVAIDELRKVPPLYRKIIIVFTDGDDNSSQKTLQHVVRRAHDSSITIYTVAYGLGSDEPLQLLAQGTRGHMYRIYSIREFSSVFARIYRALRSYYRVRYRPPECAGLHTVRLYLQLAGCTTTVSARYDRSVLTAFDTVGTMIFLPIEFDYDQATIRSESLPLIERIVEAMKVNPSLQIEIRGHTDDRGSEAYNMRLSQRRAEAVLDAIVTMGVERKRLRAVGYGKSRPLVPNTSEENRARNRRTEFVIVNN